VLLCDYYSIQLKKPYDVKRDDILTCDQKPTCHAAVDVFVHEEAGAGREIGSAV